MPDTDAMERARVCLGYGWSVAQVRAMDPGSRRLAAQFLTVRTATRSPTIRQRFTGLRWRGRRALRQRHRAA